MGILLNRLKDARARVLDTKPSDPPSKDELEMLFGVSTTEPTEQDMFVMIDKVKTWIDSISNMGSNMSLGIDILSANAGSNLVVAYQRLTLVAGNISTDTVTDDTITTKSSTDVEFDWLDSRRINVVMLGPGDGVRPMRVIFDADRNLEDSGNYAGTVFSSGNTTLQRMDWDGSDWVGIAWLAGWTVDMYQMMPAILEELA